MIADSSFREVVTVFAYLLALLLLVLQAIQIGVALERRRLGWRCGWVDALRFATAGLAGAGVLLVLRFGMGTPVGSAVLMCLMARLALTTSMNAVFPQKRGTRGRGVGRRGNG